MVTFIIGLAAGVIVMTLPEPESALKAEATRLERTMQTLANQAVMTGSVHALDVEETGYTPVRWQAGEWLDLGGIHALPDDMRLQLVPDADARGRPDPDAPVLIVFDPAGVPAKGVLELFARFGSQQISANQTASRAVQP